jgi:hypothetical protein
VITTRRVVERIGHTFAVADADETLIARPLNGRLAVALVVAFAPSGLTSPTVTVKDGPRTIGTWSLPVGDTRTLLSLPAGLTLNESLVARSSATTVIVSAWALEVG